MRIYHIFVSIQILPSRRTSLILSWTALARKWAEYLPNRMKKLTSKLDGLKDSWDVYGKTYG